MKKRNKSWFEKGGFSSGDHGGVSGRVSPPHLLLMGVLPIHQNTAEIRRKLLQDALDRPSPINVQDCGDDSFFNPWDHVICGIYGSYSSDSDDLMIETLEAVRDGKTYELIDKKGFVIEFMLYVLAGHGLTEYGTSPRGGWPEYPDLWQQLIDKWKAYRDVAWP